jgi:hypothetical protein
MYKKIMCLVAILLGGVGAYDGFTHHNLTQTGVYFLCILVAWLISEVAQPKAKKDKFWP